QDRKVTPIDALGAVLTGSTEVDGRRVEHRVPPFTARALIEDRCWRQDPLHVVAIRVGTETAVSDRGFPSSAVCSAWRR
ncbi:hypothetical protein, partial [Streptomyces anulatus]|uniref:hypothetical protein n=1 Tax=Streptomyces anulatus TaxID=1892 RepID=UPI0033CCFC5E